MDISAALTAPFVPADSVPGQVTLGCGGVARNIAHNLCLMGHEVKFVSVFGGETFGEMCWRECQAIGLDLTLSERCEGLRNGLYLCVNDLTGDMIAAVADTDIISRITPEFLETRMDDINHSALVVADTNISLQALQHLIDHCTAPLIVDTVSTAKAPRIVKALQQSEAKRLAVLKLNLIEAQSVTHQDTARAAADHLTAMGVEQVYITMGSDGCRRCNTRHPHKGHQHHRGRRRIHRRHRPRHGTGCRLPRLCPDGSQRRSCHPALPTDRQSRRVEMPESQSSLENAGSPDNPSTRN